LELVPLGALVIATLAFILAVATFWRAGDWEKSKAGEAMKAKHSALENRVTIIETKISDLPTKADIARVESEIDGVQDKLALTHAGVVRIESFLMEHGGK
jgi:hypothetical protein